LAAAIASVIDVGLGIREIHTAATTTTDSHTLVLMSTDTTITSSSSYSGSISNNIKQQQLNVVTSVSPITNIVKNIGGDRIKLTGLIPEGINSHIYELVPSDRIKIENANLVIIDGLNLEGNIEKTVNQAQSKNPQLQLLKLGDNTITKNQWIFDFSFPKEKGDPNPHLWLNVAYAAKFANLTRDKLIEMDSHNSKYYSSNAEKYLLLLKKLDEGIMQAVHTVPPQNRKLLTYHDSWSYFAPRYGMTVIGAVQPSDFGEPTPGEVARLVDQIHAERVPAIFASEVFPSRVVDQIAREANVKIVKTLSDDDLPGETGSDDPAHTYVGMMLENMRNMLLPLGGNVTAIEHIDPRDTYIPLSR
jgi:ABC-type Zn uptake system ZnuABC Zn-binding protein ZnuA